MDNNGKEKSRGELLVVAGLSGAGRSLIIQCLKGIGYFCVNSLPPVLLPKLIELMEQGSLSLRKIAVTTDLGGKELFSSSATVVNKVKSESDVIIGVMFLEADTEKLISRYKETCRTHPLMGRGKRSLINVINDEWEYLSQIRNIVNFAIDTTKLPPKELKEHIRQYYEGEGFKTFTIDVTSFGFKHGIRMDADLVFDIRSLPNPYHVVDLRPLTGLDKDVYNYAMKRKETGIFFGKLIDLLDFMIPGCKEKGKSQLVIAIGCTGGQHRSVALAERLGSYLSGVFEYNVYVHHRDVHIENGKKKWDK